MVEITIVACVLELLFNFAAYTAYTQMVLLGLAVSFLTLYVFKYETLVKAMKDSQKLNAPVPIKKVVAKKK